MRSVSATLYPRIARARSGCIRRRLSETEISDTGEAVTTAVGGQQAWNFIRKPYLLTDLVDVIQNACMQKSMNGRARA